MRSTRIVLIGCVLLVVVGLSAWALSHFLLPHSHTSVFNGSRAYQDVVAQVNFGPRVPGSAAHAEEIQYIQNELEQAGWKSQVQSATWDGFPVQNIIASRTDASPQIVLGAHYDSRMLADRDNPPMGKAVPGANDGASGVAVLLELARTLPATTVPVTLVFFDAEDSGDLNGQEWLMGSRAYVASLKTYPRAVVVLDMIGDANLNIYKEKNSNPQLTSEIWSQAAELGYGKQFIAKYKWSMLDDHTPFLEVGIPAVDIIDFDYPYWHTSADTVDKVSADSLQVVGDTVRTWLISQK